MYWLMLLSVWIVGLAFILNSGSGTNIASHEVAGGQSIFIGILILVFGSILVRVMSEFWVVIFKIQQNTRRTSELLDEVANHRNTF
ncbi:DUF4282 domain-containing protein [Acinetobacter sp. C32I]|uniref:DUF4282 domain-containing protein n=1 Tax=Acinetobacter sp. C32I TaxID=2950074 RepID=UPI00333DB2D9